MSTLDEREKGFEGKFAFDQELEFRAVSRRNRMLGEWAAALMELKDVADYAEAVVKANLEHPDEDAVLRKVSKDLADAGVHLREDAVRSKMDEFLAIARSQVKGGA